MDWKEQMQNDIDTIIKFTSPAPSTPQLNGQNRANTAPGNTTNPTINIEPPSESPARQVLRDLMPKFHKLNELFCKAYAENDLATAEELRKRLNWAISDRGG